MGQSDDIEDSTYSRHQDLCQKLNMDATAASEAWKSYSTIRQNYTLEGDQLHWIGCALYVACRESSTPTTGRPGTTVEGNCVSLTRLLRLCNLSLIQFFNKCKSWADMANMPQNFRSKIDKIERNFNVSMVIFKKYQPIFTDIFKNPAEEGGKAPRARRQKAVPCSPSRAFEFCWTLFICVKGAFPDISDDLVNSYHLLLVCCDLVYSNALLANRKDLLNPNFPGLPPNFNDESFVPSKTANCIVHLLCERHEAIGVEAKVIKEYTLRNHVNKLFNEKVLRGEQSNFSGILEALNFDGNNKAINKAYEQHVLNIGDFDERIFLAEWRREKLIGLSSGEIGGDDIATGKRGADASENIGSPAKMLNVADLHEQCQLKREQIRDLAPPTPLTGRKYLRTKEMSTITPVATATQSVIRLQALLANRQPAASEALLGLFKSCTTDPTALIENKVHTIGSLFCSSYSQNSEELDSTLDFGKKRLLLAQTLFYKLLEMILTDERRIKPDYDFTNLLTNEVFIHCLFACCLEIVIWSYKNKDRAFPWILSALNVEPFNFYKVIEVIVRAEQLARDVVKHLNDIEEKILESQAWKSNSPLWQAIDRTPGGVPSCEEVSLPGTLDSADTNAPGQPALRRLALDRGSVEVQQSPISSASERFQSPVSASAPKKRLFNDGRLGGQSLLKDEIPQKVLIDGSSRVYLAFSDQSRPTTSTPLPHPTPAINRPRKAGSVALFFRKFYNLGSTRMHSLCNSLDVHDGDLKKKIWTIFEFSVKDRPDLMKDRHLDQILMCAVYVVCKLAQIERNTFTEIMRCYRFQPQSESHIYRSVLISKGNERPVDDDADREGRSEAPPTPSHMAGTSQQFGDEIRGDLIKFYNAVYVPKVKDVAVLSKGNNSNLTLSPLPRGRALMNSPVRRVTDSVSTRTLDPKAITASPAPQLSYCFSRSPAKDLEAINRMMISVDARKSVGKRLLSDDMMDTVASTENGSPVKKMMTVPYIARKLESLMDERQTQHQ